MCNDWLKGACERKLEVGKVPENGRCSYRVSVYTADERGAGTGERGMRMSKRGSGGDAYLYINVNPLVCCGADANVMMVLFGEKGDTGERKLDSSAVSEIPSLANRFSPC